LAATTVVEPLFPSDVLTTFDPLQRTGLRLNLPVPDCAARYTDCQETAVLDQADGFSLRPRLRVRFSGPVNTATLRDGIYFQGPEGRIAINQVVWDPATNTVFAKPDVALVQQTRYELIVTDAVKDTVGAGVTGASTTFTTMSATAWLEHARDILPYIPTVVRLAEPQSTFRLADTSRIVVNFQNGANPMRFGSLVLPIESGLLAGVDRLVIGSYRSPRFLEDDQSIRPAPTLPGLQVPSNTHEVGFNAIIPETPKPAAGYPVVIFGHGFGDSRWGGPTAVSPTLARAGLATIAINAVGHGHGPFSTVSFTDRGGRTVTLPTGGRGVDLNNDGIILPEEGCNVIVPVAYGLRDCFRQTAVDLMQLVRVIRQGLDLDGDGAPDLDASRIYYAGNSLGSMYGAVFTALEPEVRAAAFNVGGGSITEVARISPAYRGFTNEVIGLRQPSLLNRGNTWDEDYPLPNQPVRVVTLPGALAIQEAFERIEWLGMSVDPLSFASRVRPRPVLFQIARGDRSMPNPASSALVQAAGTQASTWMYRHDLARATGADLPANPHPFLVLFVNLDGGAVELPSIAGLAISIDAQQQLAGFFASDGRTIPDANNFSRLLLGLPAFEVPSSLPFDLGFTP
jgi:Bacterial Ig-like domain